MTAFVTLLAQGTEQTQEAPSTGPGVALIVGALLLAVLLFALVFYVFARTTSASHGGVEPVPGSRTQTGSPPFESIEREKEGPMAPEHNPGEPEFGEHDDKAQHNPGEPEFGGDEQEGGAADLPAGEDEAEKPAAS